MEMVIGPTTVSQTSIAIEILETSHTSQPLSPSLLPVVTIETKYNDGSGTIDDTAGQLFGNERGTRCFEFVNTCAHSKYSILLIIPQADQASALEIATNALKSMEKSERPVYHKDIAQIVKQQLDSTRGFAPYSSPLPSTFMRRSSLL